MPGASVIDVPMSPRQTEIEDDLVEVIEAFRNAQDDFDVTVRNGDSLQSYLADRRIAIHTPLRKLIRDGPGEKAYERNEVEPLTKSEGRELQQRFDFYAWQNTPHVWGTYMHLLHMAQNPEVIEGILPAPRISDSIDYLVSFSGDMNTQSIREVSFGNQYLKPRESELHRRLGWPQVGFLERRRRQEWEDILERNDPYERTTQRVTDVKLTDYLTGKASEKKEARNEILQQYIPMLQQGLKDISAALEQFGHDFREKYAMHYQPDKLGVIYVRSTGGPTGSF